MWNTTYFSPRLQAFVLSSSSLAGDTLVSNDNTSILWALNMNASSTLQIERDQNVWAAQNSPLCDGAVPQARSWCLDSRSRGLNDEEMAPNSTPFYEVIWLSKHVPNPLPRPQPMARLFILLGISQQWPSTCQNISIPSKLSFAKTDWTCLNSNKHQQTRWHSQCWSKPHERMIRSKSWNAILLGSVPPTQFFFFFNVIKL